MLLAQEHEEWNCKKQLYKELTINKNEALLLDESLIRGLFKF